MPHTDRTALPTAAEGNYHWAALSMDGDRHAFAPVEDGRLPGRSVCERVRWTATAGYDGRATCRECVAILRDQLRATVAALAAAGVHIYLANDRVELSAIPVFEGMGDYTEAELRESVRG